VQVVWQAQDSPQVHGAAWTQPHAFFAQRHSFVVVIVFPFLRALLPALRPENADAAGALRLPSR
jgi:hypothetical protein